MEEQECRVPLTLLHTAADEDSQRTSTPLNFLPLDFKSGETSENRTPYSRSILNQRPDQACIQEDRNRRICKCRYSTTGSRGRKTIEQNG